MRQAGPVFVLCTARTGSTLLRDRNGEFPELPRPLAAGVRDALGQLMSQHLARRGRRAARPRVSGSRRTPDQAPGPTPE